MSLRRYLVRTAFIAAFMGVWPLLANLKHAATTGVDHCMEEREALWVDSVYQSLSLEQRIGQLIMIRAHSDKGPAYEEFVAGQIRDFEVGGVCFFQGTARRQAELTNYYQSISQQPLLVAMDAEWGLGMRLEGAEARSFPRQITLGAVQDDALIYEMGREIARQLRLIGVHINFAPVADVNNNPDNPVINFRSFGEDRHRVAQKCAAYMKGLQDGGVMACAKHFPGHGDTHVDSHYDLPVIRHDRSRLDSVEMYPFRYLTAHGLQSVMVAHLHIPALDDTPRMPSTLSRKTVHHILRQEMGFQGLVFTDAMEMKGVTKYFASGSAEVMAFQAGNDVLLMPRDIGAVVDHMMEALREGTIAASDLEASVKRILSAKYRLGLWDASPLHVEGLEAELTEPVAANIHARLVREAITLVRNTDELLPLKDPGHKRIACLNIGGGLNNPFQETMRQYLDVTLHCMSKDAGSEQIKNWVDQLRHYDLVIVGMFDLSPSPKRNFGVSTSALKLLDLLQKQTRVAVVHFGNPYGLRYYDEIPWVVQANEEDALTQIRAAEGIMGHYIVQGKLPVTASEQARSGSGLLGDNLFRLGYDLPEHVGMSPDTLLQIDGLIEKMLAKKVTPGGQILVVKNRKVVYEKAFGRFTYEEHSPPVTMQTIYDLASVTKVAATTLAVMKLHETGRLSISQPLGMYWPEALPSRKGRLLLRDILAHNAGLQAWIPFHERTMQRGQPDERYYQPVSSPGFEVPVADGLWLHAEFKQRMRDELLASKHRGGGYLYSDLGFIMLKEMVESLADMPFDQYMQETFYRDLGLQSLGFNPLQRFPRERIAPSEEDDYFRMQRIQGYVHDMTAALMGGVSGHAGLFAHAHDLAILFQMLLNGGYYGGKRFLRPETIRLFTTRCASCNRRGLGFDMKNIHGANGHISSLASDRAFGHLGFTGTSVWVDPVHDLIFIFLSNRTYPTMKNKQLQDDHYRQKIQDVVYRSIQATLPL
jgi:beta-N-acetylhexosaminidase